jgi:cytochrome c biogenesis protein CcdA/thiol-disulfide isomerase/thioredoxin
MPTLVLAYLGGLLTVLSPCILPVLPFVFARADRPFRSHGLPMLAAMAVAFAAIASLAAVAGGWAVRVNQSGRDIALIAFALFGLALLVPRVADRLAAPLVDLGNRWTGGRAGAVSPVLLGLGTGLLWAPCAGPILGLVLARAALDGPGAGTSLLLLSYAAGAATALAAGLLLGGRLLTAAQRWQGAGEVLRRGAGAAVLAAVATIALGLDTGLLNRVAQASTLDLETSLVKKAQAVPATRGPLDALAGAREWINTPPLAPQSLAGKVVLVDFWTYSCINCLRTLPYVRAWAEKYRDAGLVVIGVHSPEFAFEKSPANVRRAIKDLAIDFPVVQDNDYAIWRAFDNPAWPAFYFIDAQGRIRHRQLGEGRYDRAEQVLQQLLAEAGQAASQGELVAPRGQGTQAPTGGLPALSAETYLGYERAEGFAPGRLVRGLPHVYTAPSPVRANQWALDGHWTAERDRVLSNSANGRIVRKFHARDLHLVLGSSRGVPLRFKVLIDGKPPLQDHGSDIDAQGNGVVDAHRLYQLVRQAGQPTERVIEIEFQDPGAVAYAFTFG